MKNKSIRVVLATVIFGAFLWSLACNSGKEVSNKDTTSTSVTETAALTADPCSGSNPADKVKAVKKAVKDAIDADPILKFQHDQGKFEITIQEDTNSVISMTVKGKVFGDGSAGGSTLKDLFKVIEKYLKKSCVQSVSFEPSIAPAPPTTTAARGFEWNLCEAPATACPDGSCSTSGCSKSMNTNTNTEPKDSNSNSSSSNKIN